VGAWGVKPPTKPLRGFVLPILGKGIAHLLRKSQLFLAKKSLPSIGRAFFSQFFVLSIPPLSTVEFFPVEDKRGGGESHNTIIILCLRDKLTFLLSSNIHQLSDSYSPAQ